MARKPVKQEEPDANDKGQLSDLENILDAETLNPALQSLYTELGMEGNIEAMVHITLIEDSGKEARVWKGAPGDYDLESIAKKFGSGDYRVKVAVRNETGQMPVRGNRVITMKLSADEDMKIKMMRENPQALSAFQQPAAPTLTAEMIAAAIRAALPAPTPAPQIDFPALMKVVSDMVRTMMPAPQVQPAAAGMNPMEVLRIVKEFIPRPGERDVDDEPRRGGGSNQFDVFGKLIDKFAPMFQTAMAAQAGQAPITPTPALPAPTLGTPEMPHIEPSTVIDIPPQLRMGVAFLVSQAAGGHDPETYADVVLDQMPDDEAQRLIAMADPVAFLESVNPDVTKYRQWFVDLIQAIKESFTDETEGENASESESKTPVV